MKKSILFVCIGNSCRSPMAEGYALKYGAGRFKIRSAGTNALGHIQPSTIQVMKEDGIDITDQESSSLSLFEYVKFDYVVFMGSEVYSNNVHGRNIRTWNIADPYGEDLDSYRRIRDNIKDKVKIFLSEFEKKQ